VVWKNSKKKKKRRSFHFRRERNTSPIQIHQARIIRGTGVREKKKKKDLGEVTSQTEEGKVSHESVSLPFARALGISNMATPTCHRRPAKTEKLFRPMFPLKPTALRFSLFFFLFFQSRRWRRAPQRPRGVAKDSLAVFPWEPVCHDCQALARRIGGLFAGRCLFFLAFFFYLFFFFFRPRASAGFLHVTRQCLSRDLGNGAKQVFFSHRRPRPQRAQKQRPPVYTTGAARQ